MEMVPFTFLNQVQGVVLVLDANNREEDSLVFIYYAILTSSNTLLTSKSAFWCTTQ